MCTYVTIYWNPAAVARAGYSADHLLALAAEPAGDDAVSTFLANLPKPKTTADAPVKILHTALEVRKITERHPELFGGKGAS